MMLLTGDKLLRTMVAAFLLFAIAIIPGCVEEVQDERDCIEMPKIINDRCSKEESVDDDGESMIVGGEYDHLWTETGVVASISDNILVLQQFDVTDEKTIEVDIARAKELGRCPLTLNVGDNVSVQFFIYDRSENSITASSVTVNSSVR